MSKMTVDEEIYPHEKLWESATSLTERITTELPTPHELILPAALTSFLAYEAFINFLGYTSRPDLWSEEKKNFKGVGLEGKLDAILKMAPSYELRKGEYPYQIIQSLEKFRDKVAHGKVQHKQYKTEAQPGGRHIQWRHDWDKHLTAEALRLARTAITTFCNLLLAELRRNVDLDHPHLLHEAFAGPTGSASATSRAD